VKFTLPAAEPSRPSRRQANATGISTKAALGAE